MVNGSKTPNPVSVSDRSRLVWIGVAWCSTVRFGRCGESLVVIQEPVLSVPLARDVPRCRVNPPNHDPAKPRFYRFGSFMSAPGADECREFAVAAPWGATHRPTRPDTAAQSRLTTDALAADRSSWLSTWWLGILIRFSASSVDSEAADIALLIISRVASLVSNGTRRRPSPRGSKAVLAALESAARVYSGAAAGSCDGG
jgi:hypothetical protein